MEGDTLVDEFKDSFESTQLAVLTLLEMSE